MSVIVLGIEMPDTCEECRISIEVGSDMHCPLFTGDGHLDFGRKAECGFECRPDWCPLRPLPEKHGDLIDRNAILEEAKRISGPFTGDGWDNWGVYALIDRQPTIVEAEWQSEPLTISGTAYFIKDVIYLDPDLNQMEEE